MAAARIEQIMNTLLRPFIGSCDETQEQLSDHLDGSLSADRERRVRRHLRYCRRCRSVYESLARTVERVRSLGRAPNEPESDVSAVDAVMDRIRRSDL
jgi:predicted anti-sigma-YlaC factor YlaD